MLTDQQKAFLALAANAAVASEKTTGLPAELTLSQAIFESGWGSRAPGNNFFGIKPDDHGSGVQYFVSKEFLNGQWKTMQEAFEKYDTPEQCFEDHARLITQGAPYQKAWTAFQASPKAESDVDNLIKGICPIYATDPLYTAKILAESDSPVVTQALQAVRLLNAGEHA